MHIVTLGEILIDLCKYIITHFKTEETYFDQYDYPDTLNHKKEHQEFNVCRRAVFGAMHPTLYQLCRRSFSYCWQSLY